MSNSSAFEITVEDIETALRGASMKVANTRGRSFAQIAEDLFDALSESDFARFEKAALRAGCDLSDQTTAAQEEIRFWLTEIGVLEADARCDGVFHYLDTSTKHLSSASYAALRTNAAGDMGSITIAPYDLGCFVSVPQEADPKDPLPEDLMAILQYARLQRCVIVRIDQDGTQHADLPVLS